MIWVVLLVCVVGSVDEVMTEEDSVDEGEEAQTDTGMSLRSDVESNGFGMYQFISTEITIGLVGETGRTDVKGM